MRSDALSMGRAAGQAYDRAKADASGGDEGKMSKIVSREDAGTQSTSRALRIPPINEATNLHSVAINRASERTARFCIVTRG
jgi:hypothetical protein